MLGNLCNLNWFLFAWLALVGLRDPARPLRWRDQVVAMGVSLSIGTAILLVPLFTWRLFHAAYRRSARTWRPDALALGLIIVLGVGLPLLAGGARPSASTVSSPLQVARLWYDHAARLGALTPWLGDRVTTAVSYRSPGLAIRAAKIAVLILFLVWAWRRRSDPAAQAVVVLITGASVWSILAMLSRPYALLYFYDVGPWLYGSRYSFIMSFVGVVFWVVVLQPVRTGAVSIALWAFLALNVILPLHRFHLPRLGSEARWAEAVPAIERARSRDCATVVHVRQYPDPWTFNVRVGRTNRPCADGP
jgi:hypothetical protein